MVSLESLGDFLCARRKLSEALAGVRVLIQPAGDLPDLSLSAEPGKGHTYGPSVPYPHKCLGRKDPPTAMPLNDRKYLWLNNLSAFLVCIHVEKSIPFFQQ